MSNYIQNRPNQPLLGQALYEEILSRFQVAAAAGKTPVAGANGTIGSDWLPVVPISKGGTGAANAAQALANLGGMSSSGGTFSGRTQFTATGGAIAATSVIGQAQFNSGNSASAAAITLNHSGYYLNFGVDTDNVLKVGGGSMGNVAFPILHSGNWSQYITMPSGQAITSTNVTGSRAQGVWYQNTSGQILRLTILYTAASGNQSLYWNDSPSISPTRAIGLLPLSQQGPMNIAFVPTVNQNTLILPPGAFYYLVTSNPGSNNVNIIRWIEEYL